jgi:hypothetical protein
MQLQPEVPTFFLEPSHQIDTVELAITNEDRSQLVR